MKVFLVLIIHLLCSLCHNSCLHNKGLVKVDISYSGIISHYNDSCDEEVKHYKNPLLGYVTPWNSEGKEIAKKFALKFTLISPVWHNIKLTNNEYRITGEEQFDEQFINELREKNPEIKIVPRFNIENDALNKYYQFTGNTEAKTLAQQILTFAQYTLL